MAGKEIHIESLIIRFLKGTASKNEILELRAWINADPENKAEFKRMQMVWDSIEVSKSLDNQRLEETWQSLEKKIQRQTEYEERQSYSHRRLIPVWIYKAAAIFIFGFLSAMVLFNVYRGLERKKPLYTEVVTPMGSTSSIELPDGSMVWLNAGSKFRYPAQFSSGQRNVYLEGEAYFEVSKNKRQKFRVHTKDIIVQVYGTVFNVKSYPDDRTVETTLVEGSISVIRKSEEQDKKEIMLEPNQRLVLFRGHSKPEIDTQERERPNETGDLSMAPMESMFLSRGIDTNEFVSWRSGRLTFKSETMEQLVRKLERRYDVQFQFAEEKLKSFTYTGTISNETLEQVLNVIKLASPVDFEIDERIVTIKANTIDDQK